MSPSGRDPEPYRVAGDLTWFTHGRVTELTDAVCTASGGAIQRRTIGHSVEGRAIERLTVGRGPIKVFMWSQMHGNEPTHTAVIFELLGLWNHEPESAATREILDACTLEIIPMLNPDGAERNQRRNADGIDINRDARHLQTPEGRLLKAQAEEIRPDFAFNLHNQHRRTQVGSGKVASVSLLTPPIDEADTQTESTNRAKHVAAVFLEAVHDRCPGRVSRYDADYMPRAFGEMIQQMGVPTVLVEAGGWQTGDDRELVTLHFDGMLATLRAIATGDYLRSDRSGYEALPRSDEHRLFDLLIDGGEIHNGCGTDPFIGGLGINRDLGVSSVADVGDLFENGGLQVLDATGLVCRPGRFLYVPEFFPNQLPTLDECMNLLAQGVTSLIGTIDVVDVDQVDAVEHMGEHCGLPLHIGFVADCYGLRELTKYDAAHAVSGLSAGGVLAIIEGTDPWTDSFADWFGLPVVALEDLTPPEDDDTASLAQRLYPARGRGRLTLGAPADITIAAPGPLTTANLRYVIVAGKVAWAGGELVAPEQGHVLRRGRYLQHAPH